MVKVVLPEINFVETDPQIIANSFISTYEEFADRKLADADPIRLFILSIASVHAQLAYKANDAAKQNLLHYSRGEVLDHKGYAWTTERLGNEFAYTLMRFHISEKMDIAKIIMKGTPVTADGNIIYVTEDDAVIAPQTDYVDVSARCLIPGVIGNGMAPGEIDTMENPIPFIQAVENLTESAGGTRIESDDSYRERIRQAPEQLSTAGPTGAYEYHARKASAAISDVDVSSPEPGHVAVKVLMTDGVLPSDEIIKKVEEALSDKKVRPLTDFVTVASPTVINYDLDVSYFISSDAADKTLIEANVEAAIQSYIVWQRSKIGRDINPSRLISNCIQAGAKRVEIVSPTFTKVLEGQVAHDNLIDIKFGGAEDD